MIKLSEEELREIKELLETKISIDLDRHQTAICQAEKEWKLEYEISKKAKESKEES